MKAKMLLSALFALLLIISCPAVEGKKDEDNNVEPDDPTVDEPRCDLCENGSMGLLWPDTFVNARGSTCAQRLLDIYVKYEPDSTQCKWEIIQFRNRCCTGDTEPLEIVQAPTESPGAYQGSGGENTCELCHNGRFPAETAMVVHMLDIDIGAAPCDDYYKIGQDGLIPRHLCETIQYFAYEPCGCEYGIEVDNTQQGDERVGDDTDPPIVAPTRLPTSMPLQSSTTAAPVSISPTDSPTASPNTAIPTTETPTASLTKVPTANPTENPAISLVTTDAPTTVPTENSAGIATPTSIPTEKAGSEAPTIEFRQQRVDQFINEGKDTIAKLGSANRGGAGGQRRRRLKGRKPLV